jgi:hypothetical protein
MPEPTPIASDTSDWGCMMKQLAPHSPGDKSWGPHA